MSIPSSQSKTSPQYGQTPSNFNFRDPSSWRSATVVCHKIQGAPSLTFIIQPFKCKTPVTVDEIIDFATAVRVNLLDNLVFDVLSKRGKRCKTTSQIRVSYGSLRNPTLPSYPSPSTLASLRKPIN